MWSRPRCHRLAKGWGHNNRTGRAHALVGLTSQQRIQTLNEAHNTQSQASLVISEIFLKKDSEETIQLNVSKWNYYLTRKHENQQVSINVIEDMQASSYFKIKHFGISFIYISVWYLMQTFSVNENRSYSFPKDLHNIPNIPVIIRTELAEVWHVHFATENQTKLAPWQTHSFQSNLKEFLICSWIAWH